MIHAQAPAFVSTQELIKLISNHKSLDHFIQEITRLRFEGELIRAWISEVLTLDQGLIMDI